MHFCELVCLTCFLSNNLEYETLSCAILSHRLGLRSNTVLNNGLTLFVCYDKAGRHVWCLQCVVEESQHYQNVKTVVTESTLHDCINVNYSMFYASLSISASL